MLREIKCLSERRNNMQAWIALGIVYECLSISLKGEMNKFSEICDLREKVLREFDVKFKVKQVVKDTPKKELINYSKFKI